MSNPLIPTEVDEAVDRLNEDDYTNEDLKLLIDCFPIKKYVGKKVKKLVGKTRVYLDLHDKDKNFVKNIDEWTFKYAGGARLMEKEIKRLIPPNAVDNQEHYYKIGYSVNSSKVRNAEKRWGDKKPGIGEYYTEETKDKLIKLCNDIKDNFNNIREVNPN